MVETDLCVCTDMGMDMGMGMGMGMCLGMCMVATDLDPRCGGSRARRRPRTQVDLVRVRTAVPDPIRRLVREVVAGEPTLTTALPIENPHIADGLRREEEPQPSAVFGVGVADRREVAIGAFSGVVSGAILRRHPRAADRDAVIGKGKRWCR